MSSQPSPVRAWPLLVLGTGIMVVLVLLAWSALREPARRAQPSIPPDPLPVAAAPPDTGVEPPPVRLLPPDAPPRTPATRPQSQLTGWSRSMSDELNIPEAALEAYGYAESVLEVTRSACGLSWSVLAGIGAVESSHGRYGGADLDETGRPSKPIRGLPLDGREGVKLIRDTDDGALDGDEVFDRAVGPLQFIPTTWQEWAADADGDGVADPDDLDDAALAAGYYLCDSGGDLREPRQFWQALLTYNASHEYGQKVLNHADYYGERSRRLTARQ